VRVYNRLYELYRECRVRGQVLLNDENILSDTQDILSLRQRIGMVFPRPTPFPMSISENVAYGMKLKYRLSKNEMTSRVENAIKQVSLWEEVRDRLDESALNLNKGQQQRICIARTIAVEPEVILLDEPMFGIDHVSMMQIEELINLLKSKYTIVLVTQNMQQAARISDYTAFFYLGKIIEFGPTNRIFTNPKEKLTENYITGRFG
jgi:phosphate transport system ATP-binding protein